MPIRDLPSIWRTGPVTFSPAEHHVNTLTLRSEGGERELGRRQRDIPLLVIESRSTADGLAGLPVDLAGLTNLSSTG
jgi:hypothetical protein